MLNRKDYLQALFLPFPPSVNGSTANLPNGRRVRTSKVIKWEMEAVAKLSLQKYSTLNKRCIVIIALSAPDKRPRDDQNYAKVLIDFLVKKNILVDDNQRYIQSTVTLWVENQIPGCLVYFKEATDEWLDYLLGGKTSSM